METTIKERPILFSAPMVRAILAGRKTQTRRVIKPQPEVTGEIETLPPIQILGLKTRGGYIGGDTESFKSMAPSYCPHGFIGDWLWVRETWMPLDDDHRIGDCKCAYRATTSDEGEDIRKEHIRCGRRYQWRPSIHMPRWASRITLEITDVRVDRLNDISEEDAKAEGIETSSNGRYFKDYGNNIFNACLPVFSFASLWKSINGPDSWDENPWVWVVRFKRLEIDQ